MPPTPPGAPGGDAPLAIGGGNDPGCQPRGACGVGSGGSESMQVSNEDPRVCRFHRGHLARRESPVGAVWGVDEPMVHAVGTRVMGTAPAGPSPSGIPSRVAWDPPHPAATKSPDSPPSHQRLCRRLGRGISLQGPCRPPRRGFARPQPPHALQGPAGLFPPSKEAGEGRNGSRSLRCALISFLHFASSVRASPPRSQPLCPGRASSGRGIRGKY